MRISCPSSFLALKILQTQRFLIKGSHGPLTEYRKGFITHHSVCQMGSWHNWIIIDLFLFDLRPVLLKRIALVWSEWSIICTILPPLWELPLLSFVHSSLKAQRPPKTSHFPNVTFPSEPPTKQNVIIQASSTLWRSSCQRCLSKQCRETEGQATQGA